MQVVRGSTFSIGARVASARRARTRSGGGEIEGYPRQRITRRLHYFVRIAWAAIKRANVVSFVINTAERAKPVAAHGFACQLALHRVGKIEHCRTVGGSWKTAPNHSRPTTCVIEVDIDADDQPDDTRQNGQ